MIASLVNGSCSLWSVWPLRRVYMLKLYAHQKQIIDDAPKKIGLFLGTGSGKTRIALLLARGEVLVICPKTQREDRNWERELEGIKNPNRISLQVVSKEEFRRDAAELPHFDTVIVDEAHTCLGVTPNTRQRKRVQIPKASQLFEALDWYVQFHKPKRIYLCTATIIKSPMTVWGAAKILGRIDEDPMVSFLRFRDTYYIKLPMPGRDVYAPRSDDASKEDLAFMVRKLGYVGRLEDYVDMPEQVFKTVYTALTGEQEKRIKELPLEFPDPLVLLGKKHQVENGVLSGNEFKEQEFFANQKIEKILDYAEEFPSMIVFAKYTAQIEAIENALRKAKKTVLTLTGQTKDRQNVFKEAKKRLNYVLVCQTQISAGWELPDCGVIVFASLDFSLVNLVQAQGRINRINRPKRNLFIYLVTKKGVDEHVYKTVVHTKMDFHLAQFAQER